jgi:hypothetical protein
VIGKTFHHRGHRGTQRRIAVIAVIADIARNRRDRQGKTLPLINADDTDREDEEHLAISLWQLALVS